MRDSSCGRDALQVDVAGQQHVLGLQFALRSAQANCFARLQRLHRRLFMDRHACRCGSAPQPQRVLQRMQVARACIEHAAVETVAGDPARHLGRWDVLLHVAVDPVHALGPVLQLAPLARIGGQPEVAVAPVAVDVMAGDTLAQQVQRLDRHTPDALGLVQAELLFDDGLVAGQTVDGLAAVAPAGTPAELPRLEQRDREASLRQFQRRRQAGQTTAHHRHVARAAALQWRVCLPALGRGRVVGIAGEFAIGAQQVHEAVCARQALV